MTKEARDRVKWESMKNRFSDVALRAPTADELIRFMETAPKLRGEIWEFSSERGGFVGRDTPELIGLMKIAPEICKEVWDFLCDRRFLGTEDLRRVEAGIPDSEIVEEAQTLLRQEMRVLKERETPARASRLRG